MLEELRTFLAVAQHRNFTKAGAAISLSQPGVSAHINRLEQYFHTQLVIRGNKTVQLTDSGIVLCRRARQLLELLEATELEVLDTGGEIQGTLELGATYTNGECVLPQILTCYRQRYPKVQVHMTVGNTGQIRGLMERGQIQLGFIEGIGQSGSLEEHYFMEDTLVLLTSDRHPLAQGSAISPEQLQGQDWIGREEGSGTREYMDFYLTENHIVPRSLTVLGSNYAVKEAIRNHMGITIASSRLVREGDGIRCFTCGQGYTRPLSYLTSRDGPVSHAAKLLIKLIEEQRYHPEM